MVDTEHLVRQLLDTFTATKPHPSRGRNIYDDPSRGSVVTLYTIRIPLDSPDLNLLWALHNYSSYQTCMRYIELYRECGHWQPSVVTGNHEAVHEIMGQALVHLALFRVVHPEAPISHSQVFLFNMDSTIALYFPHAVVRTEQLLRLWTKSSSAMCEWVY